MGRGEIVEVELKSRRSGDVELEVMVWLWLMQATVVTALSLGSVLPLCSSYPG